MENIKKELHPITVWCIYSLYFAKSFRKHANKWITILNSLDTSNLSTNDINYFSRIATKIMPPDFSRVSVDKDIKIKTTKIKKESTISIIIKKIVVLETKAKQQKKYGSNKKYKGILGKIIKLKEELSKLTNKKLDIKHRVELIETLSDEGALKGPEYMKAKNLSSKFKNIKKLRDEAIDYNRRGLYSACDKSVKIANKRTNELKIKLEKLEKSIYKQ